jgi:two-component system nitrate/nitrite response regulator NarL
MVLFWSLAHSALPAAQAPQRHGEVAMDRSNDIESTLELSSGTADCRADREVRAFDLLILSDICFIREGLADVLARDGAFQITGVAAEIEQACSLVTTAPPQIILIDTALPHGITAVATLRKCASNAKIIAFALAETHTEVIAWAQAGIAGYIPRNAPLTALVGLLTSIAQGEQGCPKRIVSGLLHWISQHTRNDNMKPLESASGPSTLTAREQEIARLMNANLSNKEIARDLGISLATTKSHVHNILAKLGISKRAQAAQHCGKHHTALLHLPGAMPRQ